ncbi:MAG: hypothetical protein HY674_20430 [Chloroflexi bacterium]|nr:hypothetical protein [Chloroflexota bacterium]
MRFTVEASPNLTAWTTLATVTNVTGAVQFSDSDVSNYTQRFYRVLPLAP